MNATDIHLSVLPDVSPYRNRVEEVKGMIQKVLDLALIDFMMVSSVFKKYSQFADPTNSGDDAKRVSVSVKELQYMDIFSQKLNHIILLNQLVSEAHPNGRNHASDHAGFIFKLNYAQASVAGREFLWNAEDLRSNLHDLHQHIISVTGMDFQENQYFRHLGEVRVEMERIEDALSQIQQERYRESPISVASIENEVHKISGLYSMASERFVLLWLIKHTQATLEELLEEYNDDNYNKEEEIDLF